MTLKEIENYCLKLNDLLQRADENGELDPETSAELDRLYYLEIPEKKENKTTGVPVGHIGLRLKD